MIPTWLRAALLEYRRRLVRELGGRIERVMLFGSCARGQAHEDSDVDVLVVIAGASSKERLRAVELAAEVGLAHDLVLEPVVSSDVQWAELARREHGLRDEIGRDGIEVTA